MTYYTKPTTLGLAELADAQADGQVVPFTHIVLGDGDGAPTAPTGTESALVNQVHQAVITSIHVHESNPAWVVFEAAVDETVGGWTIREVGLVGGRGAGGILMAVGNYPATEKPLPVDGGRAMLVRVIVAYGAAAAVDFTISSMAYATHQSVLDEIAIHEAKPDPHPQYMTAAEVTAAMPSAAELYFIGAGF
jgi:phage-related tail fiber protein